MRLPKVNPTTKLSRYLYKAGEFARENEVHSSQDIFIDKSTDGTTLKLNPALIGLLQGDSLQWKGEYDANAYYGENDVVKINHDTVYTSSVGVNTSASVGIWRCCQVVPDRTISDALISAGHDADPNYAEYIRTGSVDYVPRFPEPSGSLKFWDFQSGIPKLFYMCVDGVDTPIYIDCTTSGSI